MKAKLLQKWLFGALCCLAFHSGLRAAGSSPLGQTPVRIERVALFKNGLGYFVSTAILPEQETTIQIGQLPIPVYGTFWVGYSEDVKAKRLVTTLEETETRQSVQSVGQLLLQNVGARVVLRTGVGEKDVVEGVIRKISHTDNPPETPSPYQMGIRNTTESYGRNSLIPQSENLVLVDTSNGLVALNLGSVLRADFTNKDITDTVKVTLKRPTLRLELDQPAPKKSVSVSYLARGITWSPSYHIDLSEPDQALFTAKALVINEAADLDNVSLDLVTGYPNIKFESVLSPIAMSQSLTDFLNSLSMGRTESLRGNRMLAQQAVLLNAPAFDRDEGIPMPVYSTAEQGTVSEDLFLYPVKSFSLKRGETAYLPLFTAKMPYHHLYTWKIEDMLDAEDRYRREEERADGKMAEEVWHSCRLRNTLKMPLTTAAAQFVNRGQFNGQDICYYTAPGGETTIRINRAMNILAEQAEYELERKRNAASFYGYSYDQVKVRGELKLKSRLDKTVPMEITKDFSGELVENSPGAKDIVTAKGLKKVNPKHVLTWGFDLKAGEDQKLFYVYQVYIRS